MIDPNFSLLKGAGVFFYDKQKAVIPDNLVGTQRASFVDEYVSGLTETDYDSEDDEEDYWDDEEEYDSLRDGDRSWSGRC